MSYLVDTNVLSELRRRAPDPHVARWMEQRSSSTLFLSVLTLGELRKGIAALEAGERRQRLLDWLEIELPAFFGNRVLPICAAVANQWGRLQAAAGRPIPVVDSLLAATAQEHGLSVVTRNVRDFSPLGVSVIDPWLPVV